jgi:organic radical activating enzyme
MIGDRVMKKPEPCVEWEITMKCNYKCSYCVLKSYVTKKGQHCSEETIRAVFKRLHELPGEWHIRLSGGEPCIHPRFFDICKQITEMGHQLSMVTNFSASLQNLKKLVDITGTQLIHIGASLHVDQVNIEEFVQKAVAFNSMKLATTDFAVTSVCIEQQFDLLQKIACRFDHEGIRFGLQHYLQPGGKYNTYQRKEVEEFLNRRIDQNSKNIRDTNLFGTLCHSGELFFRIDVHGEARRCYSFQPLFYLGNLTTGTFKRLREAKPCMAPRCSCPLPANQGMILYGQQAGKYCLAKTYCQGWGRNSIAMLRSRNIRRNLKMIFAQNLFLTTK